MIKVYKLWYYNLESVYLIVWKLQVFQQHSYFSIFQQVFFHHNFRQKRTFSILMVSFKRSWSESTLSKMLKNSLSIKINFYVEKWNCSCSYFRITSKIFCDSRPSILEEWASLTLSKVYTTVSTHPMAMMYACGVS